MALRRLGDRLLTQRRCHVISVLNQKNGVSSLLWNRTGFVSNRGFIVLALGFPRKIILVKFIALSLIRFHFLKQLGFCILTLIIEILLQIVDFL